MSAETSEDDDFTELVDPDITRVDVVGKAANGTTILIAKSAQGEPAGLFHPEFVRELVAKAEAEAPPATETVTLIGSPAAMASLMKQAADRRAIEYVAKAELSTSDVNDLPDSAFAYIEPGGTKDDEGKTTPRGKRHFPVHDEAHTRNALSRAPQSPFGDKAMPKIKAAAKHFGIQVAKADGSEDPGSPEWEGRDADSADGLVQAILALRPRIQALAVREGAEVGAGHIDDLCDVFDLQSAQDFLMQAAKLLGGFAVSERAEAGADVTKAQHTPTPPAAAAASSPQESTVTDTKADEATTAAPVAKSDADALTEAEYAQLGREFLRKMAAEKTAPQTTDAAAPGDDVRTIPGTETVQAPAAVPDDIAKAMAAQLATALGEAMAPVAKQVGDLAALVGSQSERVEKALAQPDDRRSPLLNGATGEPTLATRGKDPTGDARFQAVMKAVSDMSDGPEKAQLQRRIALGAIAGTMGHPAEVAARFSS